MHSEALTNQPRVGSCKTLSSSSKPTCCVSWGNMQLACLFESCTTVLVVPLGSGATPEYPVSVFPPVACNTTSQLRSVHRPLCQMRITRGHQLYALQYQPAFTNKHVREAIAHLVLLNFTMPSTLCKTVFDPALAEGRSSRSSSLGTALSLSPAPCPPRCPPRPAARPLSPPCTFLAAAKKCVPTKLKSCKDSFGNTYELQLLAKAPLKPLDMSLLTWMVSGSIALRRGSIAGVLSSSRSSLLPTETIHWIQASM
jgi:hypothetical protein